MLVGSKTMQSETNDFMLACYRMRAHYKPVPRERFRGRNGNIRGDVIERVEKSTPDAREDRYTVY